MNKSNHWPRWAFAIFGGLLVIINAALTFSFGFSYLGRSFGIGIVSDYVGALYALLIFDAGYLAWFYLYLRTAESTGQRSLAIGMAGFSLIGSLTATLQQLATNATGLVDLGSYHQAVGLVAMLVMLVATAAHVVACAAYLLLDPREKVRQMMAVARGEALEDSLQTAQRMIDIDHSQMVAQMAAVVRADVLGSLGFTQDVKQITAPMATANATPADDVASELFKPAPRVVTLQEAAADNTPLVIEEDGEEEGDSAVNFTVTGE